MKLDARAVALLEAPENAQAVMDLLTRLATRAEVAKEIPPLPPAAVAALDRTRAERRRQGLAGYVILRVDEAPDRSPSWRIIVGETVVATSKTWRESA